MGGLRCSSLHAIQVCPPAFVQVLSGLAALSHCEKCQARSSRKAALHGVMQIRASDIPTAAHRLDAFPEGLCTLPCLHTLDLSHNGLAALPGTMGQLIRLRFLSLPHNALAELPHQLSSCSKLEMLSAAHNQLREIPETFSKLQNLAALDLDSNRCVQACFRALCTHYIIFQRALQKAVHVLGLSWLMQIFGACLCYLFRL